MVPQAGPTTQQDVATMAKLAHEISYVDAWREKTKVDLSVLHCWLSMRSQTLANASFTMSDTLLSHCGMDAALVLRCLGKGCGIAMCSR